MNFHGSSACSVDSHDENTPTRPYPIPTKTGWLRSIPRIVVWKHVSTYVSLKELVVQPPTITSQPSFIHYIPTFWTAQSLKIAKWCKIMGTVFRTRTQSLGPYDVKILNPYKFKRLKNNKNHRRFGPGELGRKKGSRKSVWAKSSFFGATDRHKSR